MKWDCSDCGYGTDKPTAQQQRKWEARGQCGGLVEPNEEQMGGKDAEGYYFSATSIATDARAPCFDGNERFRVCPVWLSIAPPAQIAFRLRRHAERGTLSALVAPAEMSAWAMNALDEADAQVGAETHYTYAEKK